MLVPIILQGFAQRRYVCFQIALVNDSAWPDPFNQIALVHRFAVALDKRDEDVERATAYRDRLTALQ
jgi:hypothetical protein